MRIIDFLFFCYLNFSKIKFKTVTACGINPSVLHVQIMISKPKKNRNFLDNPTSKKNTKLIFSKNNGDSDRKQV